MPQGNHTHQTEDRSSTPNPARDQQIQKGTRLSTPLILQRAYADPSSLTATDVKHLQRTVGNRATIELLSGSTQLQAKLKLGPAGDQYEQEADRVAQQVVRQIDRPQPVQRTEEEEELAQAKPFTYDGSSLQRTPEPHQNLGFVCPGEAGLHKAKPLASGISKVQRAADPRPTKGFVLQRQEEDEEELQMKALHGPEGGAVEQSVEKQIQTARGGGKRLDDNVRGSMEQGFGADFSGVRVHTGGQADALNRSLNAKAFTVGKDVFFGKGQYNPGSSGGKQLLAHELTHTVQQGAASLQRQTQAHGSLCGCASCGTRALQRQTQAHGSQCGCASCGKQSLQRQITTQGQITTVGAHIVQRNRTAMKTDSPQLVVNVDASLLSKGAQLLKSMTRPPVVNDATADKLSNCALTTMAAIEGGKTSGEFAKGVRARQGVDAPRSTEQSQKLWAITLADKATLSTLTSSNLLTEQHHLGNKELIKSMEDFAEGNAYVVGDAQYYGMLQHLLTNAKQDSNSNVQFKVYEHGEPGNQMYPEATLVSTMQSYPDGTRFAVFVHATDPSQHVRAHWIYAETYNGNVIFKDYQTNISQITGFGAKRQTNPVVVQNFLNQFPFSPDVKSDKGKSFEDGAFIAYVPFFTGETPPVITGREVDPSAVATIISGVQTKMAELSGQLKAPDEKFSSDWSARMGSDVTEIPAPSVIEAGVRRVASIFGINPVCSLTGGSLTAPGMIKIIGNPIHSSSKIRKSIKGTSTDVKTDKLSFQDLTNTMKVVQPGRPGAQDPKELPIRNAVPDEEPEYRQAFSKAYQIQAQAGTEGISLNANWMEFTDLIHEATHSFEKATMEMHLREGLTDLFASMVAQQVQSSSGDGRWEYKYNPSYSPYVVGMQDLTQVLGLPTVAKLYFTATDHAAFLNSAIEAQLGGANTAIRGLVNRLLSFDGFPGDFNVALGELRNLLSGKAPTQTSDEAKFKTEIYDPRQVKFGKSLTQEASRLGTHYNKDLTGSGSQTDLAQGIETWSNIETAEKRLKILYSHKEAATGQQFGQLMGLIGGHEAAIAAGTGETYEVLRQRIVPMHKDFIMESFWKTLTSLPGNSSSIDALQPFFEPATGLLKAQAQGILNSPRWKTLVRSSNAFDERMRYQRQILNPKATEKIIIKLNFIKIQGRT